MLKLWISCYLKYEWNVKGMRNCSPIMGCLTGIYDHNIGPLMGYKSPLRFVFILFFSLYNFLFIYKMIKRQMLFIISIGNLLNYSYMIGLTHPTFCGGIPPSNLGLKNIITYILLYIIHAIYTFYTWNLGFLCLIKEKYTNWTR